MCYRNISFRLFSMIPVVLCFNMLTFSCDRATEKTDPPNFLFILLDDQPWDAFSKVGRYPFLETPNMDRLADEGAWFSHFYCTASLCSPSRASFLSGTFPHFHGVTQNHHSVDPNWNLAVPYTSYLQENGYETAMVGKIHMAQFNGEKHIRPGFDYWLSFKGQGEYFNPELNENGRVFREKGYMTDILTDYAIDWLENKRDPEKPFSMCLWHKAVHEPYSPPDRHKGVFSNEILPEPPYGTAAESFKNKPEWQRVKAYDYRWKEYKPVDELPVKAWDPKNPRYTSLLECLLAVNESTGRMLKYLGEKGLLDNTVIIYSSDNGYFMGEHTYWDKRIAYEPSMKIPMIIRYPERIIPGTIIEELCMNIDIAPTILELAGIDIPEQVQGRSLLPLFKEHGNPDWRDAVMFEYYVDDAYPYAGPDLIAIRTDSFKLVDSNLEHDIDELYDMINDPGEMSNLINDPNYEHIETYMRQKAKELKKEYNYNPDRDWWLRQVLAK